MLADALAPGTAEGAVRAAIKARMAAEEFSIQMIKTTGIEAKLESMGKMIADGNKADELSNFCEKVNGSPEGSVFVIPTDTVYCVVCKARSGDAATGFTPNNKGIQTLYKVKS